MIIYRQREERERRKINNRANERLKVIKWSESKTDRQTKEESINTSIEFLTKEKSPSKMTNLMYDACCKASTTTVSKPGKLFSKHSSFSNPVCMQSVFVCLFYFYFFVYSPFSGSVKLLQIRPFFVILVVVFCYWRE